MREWEEGKQKEHEGNWGGGEKEERKMHGSKNRGRGTDGQRWREDEKRMMAGKAGEVRGNVEREGEKWSETESNPAQGERERGCIERERGGEKAKPTERERERA